jgi:hypothetical protein
MPPKRVSEVDLSASSSDEAEKLKKSKASADGEQDASPTVKAERAPCMPPGMPGMIVPPMKSPAGGKKAEVKAGVKDLVESGDVPMVTKRTFCDMYIKGICTRKTHCGYAHSHAELGTKVPDPQKIKTEMCWFYTSGGNGCHMSSESCRFAHGQHELGRAVKKMFQKGKVGKGGKGKASGKANPIRKYDARSDDSRSGSGHAQRGDTRSPSKKQHARIALVRRSRGSPARRDDSRSPQVLPIIIQTCSLVEDMAPVIPL